MTADDAKRAYNREYAQKRRAADPERYNAYQRDWAKRNREKVNAAKRRWAHNNPEKVAMYRQRYWAKKAAEMSRAQGGDSNG